MHGEQGGIGQKMKTIIAGSRSIKIYKRVVEAIKTSGFVITEVVSGGAPGIDLLGENWAKHNGIPIKRFPAAWDVFGKQAGFVRNGAMISYVAPEGAINCHLGRHLQWD